MDVGPLWLQVVKSPLYPHLPANLKLFKDPPLHGPVVAIQMWYSDKRVNGMQTTFLDKHKSPVHGYAAGNTSTVNVFLQHFSFEALLG